VSAATPSTTMYSTIDHNITVAFRANWTFGANSAQPVEDANVTVEVKTSKEAVIYTFNVTTNSTGSLSFNYSIPAPEILTFTPTALFTSDGAEYNSSILQAENNLYGLQIESISVYYDTFDVALVSADTNTKGRTSVTVNVTYLLAPEEGLTLPPASSYLNQTFFPKVAEGVDVTINGVEAEEAQSGVYRADIPTWLPTSYVLVEVSKPDWSPNHEAFSFTHTSNANIWLPAVAVAVVCVLVASVVTLLRRRSNNVKLGRFPTVGGVALIGASFISLYWGVVGVDSTLHGFNWGSFAFLGFAAFAFGVAGSILSWKRKHQAAVLFVTCLSLVANVAAVKVSLDSYLLPLPWTLLALAFAVSLISGLLIGNSDDQFPAKQAYEKTKVNSQTGTATIGQDAKIRNLRNAKWHI
jgi:hypothetical protein